MAKFPIEELQRKSTKRLLAILQLCRQHGGIYDECWELNNNCCGNDFASEIYADDVKAILSTREHIKNKPKPKRTR